MKPSIDKPLGLGRFRSLIRILAGKPVLLAALLSLPLWVVLGNFIVAASVGLLLAFLLAMGHSLHVIKKRREQGSSRQEP